MINLSDTQRILLSTASQRENGSLLPLPMCVKPGGGAAKALDAILKRGLAEARETSDANAVRRIDGDLQFGLFITVAGLAEIGVESEAHAADGDENVAAPSAAAKPSKAAAVLDLLRRPAGATLPELIEATGWLPHTTRAALTGIRKKGYEVTRSKRDGATCYSIMVTG